MSWDRRDHQIKQYQDRIRQLQYENQLLRGGTPLRPTHNDSQVNALMDLASRNEKLERQTEAYQREIKRELTDFIRESNMLRECNFKQKYINSLAYPPAKHVSFRRL